MDQPDTSRGTVVLTRPPRSTAPSTATFFDAFRPRCVLSSARLFAFTGFPPTNVSSASTSPSSSSFSPSEAIAVRIRCCMYQADF